MSERDFVSRTDAARMNADQRHAWCKARARDADRQGGRWHRFDFNKAAQTLLYEGWKARPGSEVQLISGPSAAV